MNDSAKEGGLTQFWELFTLIPLCAQRFQTLIALIHVFENSQVSSWMRGFFKGKKTTLQVLVLHVSKKAKLSPQRITVTSSDVSYSPLLAESSIGVSYMILNQVEVTPIHNGRDVPLDWPNKTQNLQSSTKVLEHYPQSLDLPPFPQSNIEKTELFMQGWVTITLTATLIQGGGERNGHKGRYSQICKSFPNFKPISKHILKCSNYFCSSL